MATQSKKPFHPADNPIEQLKDVAVGAVNDVVNEVPKQIFDEALYQIGIKARKPLSGEINIATGTHQTTAETIVETSEGHKIQQLRYVQKQEQEVFNLQKKTTQAEIQRVMQELSAEIKRLQTQTSQLTQEVKTITVESAPARPGIYYTNFFEWVLMTLRDLRGKVNESRQWLALWTAKKKQKGYWAMFKKHGTSFAMSEERAIASANG